MQTLIRSGGLILLAVILLAGCAGMDKLSQGGMEMSQVPISEHPGSIQPGKFVWHDLLTPDPRTAGKFYERLFGWEIDYRGKYAVVRHQGRLLAGILEVEPEDGRAKRGIWIPSVSVTDVDRAVTRVRANGGKVRKGPLDMPRRGRAALIEDPQRSPLVLLRAKDGDPEDREAGFGDWLWDEIWTDDPERVQAFYSAVLGYDGLLSGDGYQVFLTGEQWRAGMRHLQEEQKFLAWVPVVRVADPDATVRQVGALGGIVWVTPEQAPGNGDTALIADPTGALLLIQRWPRSSTQAEEGGS